jgi:hypothetical protein
MGLRKIVNIIHEAKVIKHQSSWGIAKYALYPYPILVLISSSYQNLEYARYSIGFIVKRPLSVFFIKILPPILITQFVALGTFFIDIEVFTSLSLSLFFYFSLFCVSFFLIFNAASPNSKSLAMSSTMIRG